MYKKNKIISLKMEIVSERARTQDGEKNSFVFFRDKSYIGWEDLFIGSQSDIQIS